MAAGYVVVAAVVAVIMHGGSYSEGDCTILGDARCLELNACVPWIWRVIVVSYSVYNL